MWRSRMSILDGLNVALHMKRDVYSGWLRLHGEEHEQTLRAANNYADAALKLPRCFEEAKSRCAKRSPWGDVCSRGKS